MKEGVESQEHRFTVLAAVTLVGILSITSLLLEALPKPSSQIPLLAAAADSEALDTKCPKNDVYTCKYPETDPKTGKPCGEGEPVSNGQVNGECVAPDKAEATSADGKSLETPTTAQEQGGIPALEPEPTATQSPPPLETAPGTESSAPSNAASEPIYDGSTGVCVENCQTPPYFQPIPTMPPTESSLGAPPEVNGSPYYANTEGMVLNETTGQLEGTPPPQPTYPTTELPDNPLSPQVLSPGSSIGTYNEGDQNYQYVSPLAQQAGINDIGSQVPTGNGGALMPVPNMPSTESIPTPTTGTYAPLESGNLTNSPGYQIPGASYLNPNGAEAFTQASAPPLGPTPGASGGSTFANTDNNLFNPQPIANQAPASFAPATPFQQFVNTLSDTWSKFLNLF